MTHGTSSEFKVEVAHRLSIRRGAVSVFLANAGHDVQPVVHTNGQQQHWNGVHGGVEGHLYACKLQPAGEAVGGADGQHGQDHHVRGVPHATEVEPQDDAEQDEGGGGQDANFRTQAGVGPFGELSEGERPYDLSISFNQVGLERGDVLHDDGVDLVRRFHVPRGGLAVDDQRDQHWAVAVPRRVAVLAGQARQDQVTEIDALQAKHRTKRTAGHAHGGPHLSGTGWV